MTNPSQLAAEKCVELATKWGAPAFDSSGHHRELENNRITSLERIIASIYAEPIVLLERERDTARSALKHRVESDQKQQARHAEYERKVGELLKAWDYFADPGKTWTNQTLFEAKERVRAAADALRGKDKT